MSFTITKLTLEHRSGTKEYHLLLIENSLAQKSVLVNRWGKAGAWGQMKTERGTAYDMAQSYRTKLNEKEGRGYRVVSSKPFTASSVEEAKTMIGINYWAQIGADNLQHVFPGVDTTGVRESKPAVWKETPDGKYERDDKPEYSMPTEEDRREEERQKVEEQKQNPNWGMF